MYIYIYMTRFSQLFFNTVGYCPAVYRWGGVFCIFFFWYAPPHTNRLCQCTGPRAISWAGEYEKI